MAETVISQRDFFPKGEQKKFIKNVQSTLSLDSKALAELAGKSARTLADWKREKFSMPLSAAEFLSEKSGIPLHANVKIKEAYWYTSLGSSAGGTAVYEKYGHIGGDQEERKEKWHIWWSTIGQFQKHAILNIVKPIKKPIFSSSLADNIVISRTELVQFCVNKLGLKIGSKVRQQIDIPLWVKERKSYRIACLRGLVDTDGCVIKHRYSVKGKKYCYKKLSFTNSSVPLLRSVFEILSTLGMKPRVTNNGKEVRLESQSDMERYFRLVGSNNPKHLNRWLN